MARASNPRPPKAEPAPAAPVATEPGCQHPECTLVHPHAGPAVLAPAPAPPDGRTPPRRPPAPERPQPQFVRATKRLYVGVALAHVPGDLVPAQNVQRNGWADGVEPLDG